MSKKARKGVEVIELPGVTVRVDVGAARVFLSELEPESLKHYVAGYYGRRTEATEEAKQHGQTGGRGRKRDDDGKARERVGERRAREIEANSRRHPEAVIADLAEDEGIRRASVKRSLAPSRRRKQ